MAEKSAEYKDLAVSTEGRTVTGDDSRNAMIRNFGYQEETGSGAADWFSNLLTTDYFWNNNREPAPAFNFFLRIEAAFDAPCRSVRAFTKENEFEEIQEGGRNDYVILKRKPISRRFQLQVERYVGIDKIDPLQLGTEMVLPMILAVSRVTSSSSGFADTLSETEFIRFYAFTGCIVTGKEYGELNAEQSGLLREVTTIAYREMVALTTPNADMTETPWDIEKWNRSGYDPNARANDPFPAWNDARAEVRSWGVRDHAANKDNPENDMRSAARPKVDENRQTARMWGGFDENSHDKKKNKSASPNQYDESRAEAKLWKMPEKGQKASANNNLRSATVNDRSDKARAVKKAWKIKKGKIDARGRSATVPNSDERHARVKSWNMDPTLTRQSKATKPTGDRRKARAKSFMIKRPEKNMFADKPVGDDARAVAANMLNGENRATVNSANDTARAEKKRWDIQNKKEGRSAEIPKNDTAKAGARLWNVDSSKGRESSAVKPTGDDKRAKAANMFNGQKSATVNEKNDITRAAKKRWAIQNKKTDRSAEIPKNDESRSGKRTWYISPDRARQSSAVKPAGDRERAASKAFEVSEPGANSFANKPVGDAARARSANMLNGQKSALVNEKNDKTRAAVKAWRAKGGNKESRSAVVPTSDTARAKVSSWNMDSKKGRSSSANKPQTDAKKAKAMAFDIKKPGNLSFATKPKGDKDRAAVINFLNGGKRAR